METMTKNPNLDALMERRSSTEGLTAEDVTLMGNALVSLLSYTQQRDRALAREDDSPEKSRELETLTKVMSIIDAQLDTTPIVFDRGL
jgi:hypothetical protein